MLAEQLSQRFTKGIMNYTDLTYAFTIFVPDQAGYFHEFHDPISSYEPIVMYCSDSQQAAREFTRCLGDFGISPHKYPTFLVRWNDKGNMHLRQFTHVETEPPVFEAVASPFGVNS